jgi:hypothetical protein
MSYRNLYHSILRNALGLMKYILPVPKLFRFQFFASFKGKIPQHPVAVVLGAATQENSIQIHRLKRLINGRVWPPETYDID